jgi:hypothetical protein
MAHDIHIHTDDEGRRTVRYIIYPDACTELDWWVLMDSAIWSEAQMREENLPPRGISKRADAIREQRRRSDIQTRRITTRRSDAWDGVSLDEADAAVVRAYRRAYASEGDDALARDAAEERDPRGRSRDRINAVLRNAGIRARARKPRR